MLGKLIKYDFSSYMRVFIGMAAGMLLLAFIFPLIYESSDSMKNLKLLIFMLVMVVVAVLSIVLVVQSYNRSLFTNTGYLMFSLPVSPELMVISKILVSMFWFVVMCFAGFFSLILMYRDSTQLRWSFFADQANIGFMICLEALFYIVTSFLCIALSHVSVKNKTASGIIGFAAFIILVVLQTLTAKYVFGFNMTDLSVNSQGISLVMKTGAANHLNTNLSLLLFSVLEFFGLTAILRHRLNLP